MIKDALGIGLIVFVFFCLGTMWASIMIGTTARTLIEVWWKKREEHIKRMSHFPGMNDFEMTNERAN